jgi:hypothetical protein
MLALDCFLTHPEQSWPILREIFYDHFGRAKLNRADGGSCSVMP